MSNKTPDEYESPLTRIPDGVTISPEATKAILRVEKGGFFWRFWIGSPNDDGMVSVYIRLQIDRWTAYRAHGPDFSECVLSCFEQFAILLPGLRGMLV